MAYKVNDTTVIDDTGNIQSVAGLTLNNDSGVISVQSTSPMVGTVAGYTSGGGGPPYSNIIEKFPFAVDTNATDVGDLITGSYFAAGQSSTTFGYHTNGFKGPPPPAFLNTITKFSFASNANATDVGDTTQARSGVSGSSSSISGYTAGGSTIPANVNTIDKFPFSSDSNATDVGDLTEGRQHIAGQSSSTFGYASGGQPPPGAFVNTIDKFSFSVDNNASDVGDLTRIGGYVSGQSSTVSGYTSGGINANPPFTALNTIDKFPFATDTNATDVGDLTVVIGHTAGQSSVAFGYTSGGRVPGASNIIQKFPFATDTNATDVGGLTQARIGPVGQQD